MVKLSLGVIERFTPAIDAVALVKVIVSPSLKTSFTSMDKSPIVIGKSTVAVPFSLESVALLNREFVSISLKVFERSGISTLNMGKMRPRTEAIWSIVPKAFNLFHCMYAV